jgi:hypothetical protein
MNISNEQAKTEAATAPMDEVLAAPRVGHNHNFILTQQSHTAPPHNNIIAQVDDGPTSPPPHTATNRTQTNERRTQKHSNTCAANRFNQTITQDCILSTIKMTNTPVTPKQLASRRFPIQILNEIAGAILNHEVNC